jgi:hypothetical protein
MNRSLSRQLAMGLKSAGVLSRNYVNQQLFRTLHGIAPISIDDNSDAYIRQGYQYNPDVYSIVNAITRMASAVPPQVMIVKDEKSARQYYRLKHGWKNGVENGFLDRAEKLRKKAFEEAPDNDPLTQLIAQPNPMQSWSEFVENSMGFMEITGNSYTHGVELSDGRIGEMWVMPSQYTQIIADKSSETIVTGYTLMLYGYQQSIPPETVMHVKYWNPDYSFAGSHLYGMSPLMSARRSIRTSNDSLDSLSKALQNNGAAGMLFPDHPDISQLTPDQVDSLQRFFDNNKKGAENYKAALVTSAKMGWQSFGMSPVDLEIIDTKKMSMRDLCNIYGFPSRKC